MRIIKKLALGLTLILLSSCTKTFEHFCHDSRVMIRTAGTANGGGTKSTVPTLSHSYPMQDGLVLEETVSDYGFEGDGLTKGAIITTDGHNKINESGREFNIEGWLGPDIATPGYDSSAEDKANQHFMSDSPEYDGSSWKMSSEHLWRNGISTTFWSYYVPEGGQSPVFSWPGNTPTASELGNLNFTYTLPAPSGSDNDAELSNDFLIAYNKEMRTINDGVLEMTSGTGVTSKKNSISIHFHHPLSAIKFKVGSISGDKAETADEYVKITKVELVDVKTSGSFTAEGATPNGCTVTCNSTSGKASYSQSVTRAEIESGKFTDAASEFVFFMIPQDLSGVKIRLTMARKKKTVTYEADGKTIQSTTYGEEITFTRDVSLSGAWDPGYYYTYSINSVIYFGGEELTLKKDDIETKSDNIIVDKDGKFSFNISGSLEFREWVAPLPAAGVKILKLTFTHTYTNSSGKSARRIWLENASLNPEWTGPDDKDHDHFINPDNIFTYNADLVAEAVALPKASTYWKDKHYTGYLGEYTKSGSGAYNATDYDNNMNKDKGATNVESVMYFYLGGKFDYVKIHFDYDGATGGGSIGWSADVPIFNITEVME